MKHREHLTEFEERQRTRPFIELRDTGLLWLINATVFHPRGFALAVVPDDDGGAAGWRLAGDGSEPWQFGDDVNDLFRATQQLFAEHSEVSQ